MKITDLGIEGKKIWRKWKKQMGTPISDGDLKDASDWLIELYESGQKGSPIQYRPGGMPLNHNERQAIEAGKKDR